MANPINPFSGGGGYGSILPSEYQQISSMVGEKFVADENKKIDSLQSALNSIIGMGAKAGGGDAGMAASLLPSSLNEYYAKASEAQGKAKAYEGLMKTSPELFGLSSDQAKGFADFASKLPPTAVPEFYQLALKGGMAQQEQQNAINKILTGAFSSKAAELLGTPTPPTPSMPNNISGTEQSSPSSLVVPKETLGGTLPDNTQYQKLKKKNNWHSFQPSF